MEATHRGVSLLFHARNRSSLASCGSARCLAERATAHRDRTPHRLDEAVSEDVAVTRRVEVVGIEFGMPESLSANAAPERHLPFELRLSMHVLRSARCTNGTLHVDAAGMPQVEVRLVAEEDMRPFVLCPVQILVGECETPLQVEIGKSMLCVLNATE